MKKRYFREPLIMYLGLPFLFIGGFASGVFTMVVWYIGLKNNELSTINIIAGLPLALFCCIFSTVFQFSYIGDRLDFLCVKPQGVVWRCYLRRTRRLDYAECLYIGVENFDKEYAHTPIYRGDENTMIYFTTEPFPEDKRGHVNHVRCSDRFIKFRYTDKLAEALLEVLPPEKKTEIQIFYNRMKSFDYQAEQARRQRKKKKSRRK